MKIKHELKNIELLDQLVKDKEYRIAYWSLVDGIVRRVGLNKLYAKTHYFRYKACKKYLISRYAYLLDKYLKQSSRISYENVVKKDAPVWIFWWQGLSEMPFPVNLCLDSVKRHCGSHSVRFISKYNYKEYVDVPKYIERKFEAGQISYAHFSDFLRMALLKKYGGIWLDSTLYMCKDFPDIIYQLPFYTINQGGRRKWIVSKDKWSIGLLCAGVDNPLIKFWYDFICEYWKNEDFAISYLVTDCMLAVGYEKLPFIYKMINYVPINNPNAFLFTTSFGNKTKKEKEFEKLLNENFIFQLTYKNNYDMSNRSNTNFQNLIKIR